MTKSYQFTIGEYQCWAVNDGEMAADSNFLFANAPAAELARVLERDDLDPSQMPSPLTHLLIQTPGVNVLIDTGFGTGSPTAGRLVKNLAEIGFQASDIDIVFLTHVHMDHVGGCVNAQGQVAFPYADFYIAQKAWDFWTSEDNLEQVPQWAAQLAREKLPPIAGQINKVTQETEIVPGVTAVPAYGHTVGHMVVEVASGSDVLLNLADTALHPLHVEYPEWNAALDMFPEQAVAARHAVYQRAVAKNALVLAFHFSPFPSLGHIRRENGRYRWHPLAVSR